MSISSFRQRLEAGLIFEQQAIAQLMVRGWLAESFGQGQLSPEMRDILREIDTPVRGMPDIIAAKRGRDQPVVRFIDAKAGEKWRETGNHDVETYALENAEEWVRMSKCQVYFLFTDRQVITPAVFREMARPGVFRGAGSGTPFMIVSREVCQPFDVVFGPPDQWQQAG